MPHECTNCGRVFPDGSKKMLSGCPNCGGNKFQFRPSSQEARSKPQSGREQSDSHSQSQSETRPMADTHTQTTSTSTDTQQSSSNTDPVPKPDTTEYNSVGADTAANPEYEHERANTSAGKDHTHQSETDSHFDPWSHTDGAESRKESERVDSADTRHEISEDAEKKRVEDSTESTPHISSDETNRSSLDTANSTEDSTFDHLSEEHTEDNAQASARGDIVSPEELAAVGSSSDAEYYPQQESSSPPEQSDSSLKNASQTSGDNPQQSSGSPEEDGPDLGDLRTELNQQFESIRIVAPGQYELNLMELYDRSEYIISLQEDGRYVIEVPNAGDGLSDNIE
jgi:predicted  nucleic acid-binding Zn-ribbon protein